MWATLVGLLVNTVIHVLMRNANKKLLKFSPALLSFLIFLLCNIGLKFND